ncbi:hypothetical protein EDD98_6161 [Streptomyces sp. PanSC19]|nr:hypothetical protein EDD98_6161 [Streptomyces sp. PanSC19]
MPVASSISSRRRPASIRRPSRSGTAVATTLSVSSRGRPAGRERRSSAAPLRDAGGRRSGEQERLLAEGTGCWKGVSGVRPTVARKRERESQGRCRAHQLVENVLRGHVAQDGPVRARDGDGSAVSASRGPSPPDDGRGRPARPGRLTHGRSLTPSRPRAETVPRQAYVLLRHCRGKANRHREPDPCRSPGRPSAARRRETRCRAPGGRSTTSRSTAVPRGAALKRTCRRPSPRAPTSPDRSGADGRCPNPFPGTLRLTPRRTSHLYASTRM